MKTSVILLGARGDRVLFPPVNTQQRGATGPGCRLAGLETASSVRDIASHVPPKQMLRHYSLIFKDGCEANAVDQLSRSQNLKCRVLCQSGSSHRRVH